ASPPVFATLSLHDALPIFGETGAALALRQEQVPQTRGFSDGLQLLDDGGGLPPVAFANLVIEGFFVRVDVLVHEGGKPRQQLLQDRKSTRLNSSHVAISYA